MRPTTFTKPILIFTLCGVNTKEVVCFWCKLWVYGVNCWVNIDNQEYSVCTCPNERPVTNRPTCTVCHERPVTKKSKRKDGTQQYHKHCGRCDIAARRQRIVAKCEEDFAKVLSRERAAAIKEVNILSQSTQALQQQWMGAEKRLSEMVSQYNEAQDSIINLTVRLENTAASLHTCRGMNLKREAEIKRLNDRTAVLQQLVEDAEVRLEAVTTETQKNLAELQVACTVVETDLDLKIGEMKAMKNGHDTEVQHYVKQTRDLNNEISALSRNLIDLEIKHGKLIWNLMVSRVVNVGLLAVGAATSLYLMFGF